MSIYMITQSLIIGHYHLPLTRPYLLLLLQLAITMDFFYSYTKKEDFRYKISRKLNWLMLAAIFIIETCVYLGEFVGGDQQK